MVFEVVLRDTEGDCEVVRPDLVKSIGTSASGAGTGDGNSPDMAKLPCPTDVTTAIGADAGAEAAAPKAA